MLFIREIKYFDYMEAGCKIGHVGHARIELWEKDGMLLYDAEDGEIHIRISNLPGNISGSAMVELLTVHGSFAMGEINLAGGGGTFVYAQSRLTEEIDGNLAFNQILGIKIAFGQQKEAFCKINEVQNTNFDVDVQKEIATEIAKEVNAELPDEKIIYAQMESATHDESLKPEGIASSDESLNQGGFASVGESLNRGRAAITAENLNGEKFMENAEKRSEGETVKAWEENVKEVNEMENGVKTKKAQDIAPMGEDKWSHLCNIYPRITPFADNREYLQIGPGDFVLLSSKHYALINNSFMLHGYYHYGQLVLCRVIKRGKAMYYLGTPGIYLEREKQVAIMYGFESFECASEPATEGDFGYYMVQVEL